VHDEAVASVPTEESEDYAHEMQESLIFGMQSIVRKCPVKAEIARMKNGSLPDIWLP